MLLRQLRLDFNPIDCTDLFREQMGVVETVSYGLVKKESHRYKCKRCPIKNGSQKKRD